MSLGDLVTIKANNPGYTPLLLCAFTFQNSTTKLLVSTHPFNSTEGGPTFPGIGVLPSGSYLARVQQQDISAIQQRSQLGIDRIAEVTIHLTDPDHYIWSNYGFLATDYGFRGASVQMALVMWQPGTSNFSTDAPVMFVGTCDQESFSAGGNVISVHCNNGHNTATVKLPNFPIQNRCPHAFPSTSAQRNSAVNDPSSIYYQCGYGPDQSGGCGNTGPANHVDGYGNQVTDSSGIFLVCDYIRSNSNDATSGCMARLGNSATTSVAPDGDLMHDKSGRATGRFAGVQFSPGTYYAIDKNYTSSSQIPTFSFQNAAILGQYQNLLYGTQWVNAKLANVIEDGNATRCEAMICEGDVGAYGIQIVTANGVEIPWYSNLSAGFGSSGLDPLFRWNFTNTGGRNGNATADAGYNSPGHSALGDTYGSICCIEVVFYKDVFTGFGTPQIQALASGPQLYRFTSPTSSTLEGAPYNYYPPWVLLDLLIRANWTYGEINIQSFINAEAVCSTSINYVDQTGATTSHERYRCMFSLEQRKTAGEVIAGVLRSFNGYLFWDQNGLLNLGINQTLADSQPSPISGSNYNTGVASIHADNSSGTGYVAWSFSEADVLRKADGSPDIDMVMSATVQTPNEVVISFQDSDNQYQTDSLTEDDPDAITRAGGALQPGGSIVPETLNCIGISNFDQATRIANVYLAERQRGNAADDPRGTMTLTFGTDVRIEHLRVGHIVLFSWQSLGISNQLFRVQAISPQTDWQPCRVTISWLNEVWYTDIYGQAPQAFYSETNRNRPQRGPKPWQPDLEVPNSSTWSSTELSFGCAEVDIPQADGSTLVTMKLTGTYPVNQVSTAFGPPLVPVQATTASTGGTITGGQNCYIQICALDSSGNYSAPSKTIGINIPSGTNTNTVTVSNLAWQAGTAGYDVFAGTDHWNITHQLRVDSGTPSSITLTSMPNVAAYAPPDLAASTLMAQAKVVIHGGIIGTNIANVTSTGITLAGPSGTLTNNLTGYKVLLAGRSGLAGANLSLIDFEITSNSSYVLTLDRNPTGILNVNDIVIISQQANIASATTIGDANIVNNYYPGGATSAENVGMLVRIIAGTGRYQVRTITAVTSNDTYTVSQPWDIIPDSTSWFIVEEPSWRYDSSTVQINSEPYYNQTMTTSVNMGNYAQQTILVQALLGDPTGTLWSNQYRSPVRMMWLIGQPGDAAAVVVTIATP